MGKETREDAVDASTSSKDRVIFIDKETDAQPLDKNSPVLELLTKEDTTGYEGPIKENGEINWGCPCMAGMISGPCGYEFKQAFSCFHYSTADPKGSDCLEQFVTMRECFDKYPSLYPIPDKDGEDDADKGGIFDTETAEDDARPVGRNRLNPSQ